MAAQLIGIEVESHLHLRLALFCLSFLFGPAKPQGRYVVIVPANSFLFARLS